MTAPEVLSAVLATGSRVAVKDGNLVIDAPVGAVDEDMRHVLKQHKPEIIALLDEQLPRPYIDECGGLHIPFASSPRYHWWRGGQSVEVTLIELGAPPEVLRRYVE